MDVEPNYFEWNDVGIQWKGTVTVCFCFSFLACMSRDGLMFCTRNMLQYPVSTSTKSLSTNGHLRT